MPWYDATFYGIPSGFTLFVVACICNLSIKKFGLMLYEDNFWRSLEDRSSMDATDKILMGYLSFLIAPLTWKIEHLNKEALKKKKRSLTAAA